MFILCIDICKHNNLVLVTWCDVYVRENIKSLHTTPRYIGHLIVCEIIPQHSVVLTLLYYCMWNMSLYSAIVSSICACL